MSERQPASQRTTHAPRRPGGRRHGSLLGALVSGVQALAACGPIDATPGELAAMQLAAASALARDIASNPGPIEAICVSYEEAGSRPGLPGVASAIVVSYANECAETDGRLVAREGGGQAIRVSVRAPEPTGRTEAEVRVLTSTGSNDLAAYRCRVRERDGDWDAEGCDLEAIS